MKLFRLVSYSMPIAMAAGLALFCPAAIAGDDAKAVVEKLADKYEAAFKKGDAAAVASLWSEDGTFVSTDGREVSGRKDIEKMYSEFFKDFGAFDIDVVVESAKPLGESAILEKGSVQATDDSGERIRSTEYSVIHVKDGDGWKIASAIERSVTPEPLTLKAIAWLAGNWHACGARGEITLKNNWQGKNFLVGTFTLKGKDGLDRTDTQVIGVDPYTGTLRSWIFDSDGGVGTGDWCRDGKGFVIDVKRVTEEGLRSTCRDYLRRQDDGSFTWKSTEIDVDGELLPDTEEIKVEKAE
ncbi:MAG: nuclear transport factor 2 family protein [Cyanobacteria bacterium HKST-UBA02]|nr:nuclear transport factor 2 family protein [Cyanobacteria bacterium HKST-UBA02]